MPKKWRKQSGLYENPHNSGARIDTTPVCGSLPTVSGSLSPATRRNDKAAKGGFKPLEVLKGRRTPGDSLQVEEPSSSSLKKIPPSPAPASPTPIQSFHQGLYRAFQSAGKPTPLLSQSEIALAALSQDWEAFLRWLPTAPQFEQTRTPGGIPTLIEFFREKPTKEAPAEIPAPCRKCRTLDGRVLKRIPGKGVFAGESYTALVECDCPLGELLKAGFERAKAERPKRALDFKGFEEPEETETGFEGPEKYA